MTLKGELVQCVGQECGLGEDLSADTQKANIEFYIRALDHAEVREASPEVRSVIVFVLRTVILHPQPPAAKYVFVNPKANLRKKTKERRGRCVAGHDLVLSSWHGSVLLEEIGVHLSELKGCDCVRVFAVFPKMPKWLSAILVHDYFDERFGGLGVDVRT